MPNRRKSPKLTSVQLPPFNPGSIAKELSFHQDTVEDEERENLVDHDTTDADQVPFWTLWMSRQNGGASGYSTPWRNLADERMLDDSPRPVVPLPHRTPSASASVTHASTSSTSKPSSRKRTPLPTPIPDLIDPDTLRHKAPYQMAERQKKLDRIQAQWDEATNLVGAARVTIANDIDNDLPSVPSGFEYLENGYVLATAQSDDGFLYGCQCGKWCNYAEDCCGETKTFPYSDKGLFMFNVPQGSVIIECNKKCPCSSRCRNRVAQRPRTIPLEVFKTRQCGWGVRATLSIRRGQVLGLYSGELIQRTAADKLTGPRRQYIFDLDHQMGGEDEPPLNEQYSVDGYDKGNWSRFINHSCDPNLQVWSVQYDTTEESRPYLAFIATRYIPIRAELTLDYNPGARFDESARKGKGKSKDRGCLCGSERCREAGVWRGRITTDPSETTQALEAN